MGFKIVISSARVWQDLFSCAFDFSWPHDVRCTLTMPSVSRSGLKAWTAEECVMLAVPLFGLNINQDLK